MSYKTFDYYPVDIKQSYTGKKVKGFKFPAGDDFDETSVADVENLQQFQLYLGVNEVISSLEDLLRTGTNKTNKLYNTLLKSLIEDYNKVCITCLSLASSMCWVPTYDNKENATGAFLLLAVQAKMDLAFPNQLVKNIARIEIEKKIIDLKETTGDIKKIVSKH